MKKNDKQTFILLATGVVSSSALIVNTIVSRRQETKRRKVLEESAKAYKECMIELNHFNGILGRGIETATFWDIVTRD